MIVDHREFLVSLEQLRELALALASVKRDAASPGVFHVQAASIQKEICRIRHDIDTYLGVADLHLSEPQDTADDYQHREPWSTPDTLGATQ